MMGWAEKYLAWFIGGCIAPDREEGRPVTLSAPPPSADPFLVCIALIAALWGYLKRSLVENR
jgi:hypothetical protein